jgi:hypothetical protein
MSLDEDKLEVLIGKCLDHQATPMEQHLIEKEMNQDPKARELFDQWQTLNEWGRELVVDKLVGQGARPEDVFERAWQRSRGITWLRLVMPGRQMRFAVGVAAGFLLGVILHFTLVWTTGTTGVDQSRRGLVVAESAVPTGVGQQATGATVATVSRPESRNVPEYYPFTDNAGNQYMIQRDQRVKENGNRVRLAAYSL